MDPFSYRDHRADPQAWADELGVSREAIDLYLACEVVDLHVETFSWTRSFGYDVLRRHGHGPFGARLLGQVDLPRLREAQVGGAVWSLTTNPFRVSSEREAGFVEGLSRLRSTFARAADHVEMVTTAAEYFAARARGRHAAFVGIQGGNALDGSGRALERLADGSVVLVTLLHMGPSSLGSPSTPLWSGEGLTASGRAFVERLNAMRVFVDLAHVDRKGFWDAVDVHDPRQPLLVSHAAVDGVYPQFRNLDDRQIRAVADRGGVVGLIYHALFLEGAWLGTTLAKLVEHLMHLIRVGGEDVAALGSDWDGLICPPRDMPTCLELPRLVEALLARGLSPRTVEKVLGLNFLRALEVLRPTRT